MSLSSSIIVMLIAAVFVIICLGAPSSATEEPHALISRSVVEVLRAQGLHWRASEVEGDVRIDSEGSDYAVVVVPGNIILAFEERLTRRSKGTAQREGRGGSRARRVGTCTISDPVNDNALAVFQYAVEMEGGDPSDGHVAAAANDDSTWTALHDPTGVHVGQARFSVTKEGGASVIRVTLKGIEDVVISDEVELIGVSESAAAQLEALRAASSSWWRRWLWPLLLVIGAYVLLWAAASIASKRRQREAEATTATSGDGVSSFQKKVKTQ